MRYIYVIQNETNYKIYVGQSKAPNKRWVRHKYDAMIRNHKLPLYNSIRKYGVDNFNFYIIEELPDNEIDSSEEFWIQYFRSWDANYGYNLELGGCKNKIISQETKNKQSISSKKRYTNETTIKLRESKRTPLARKHASESSTGSKNPRANINEDIVLSIRKLWQTGNYKQIELAVIFNIPKTTINHIIKRYTWKHI